MSKMLFSDALKKPGLYWLFRESWKTPLKIQVIRTNGTEAWVQTRDSPFLIFTDYDAKWIAFDNFWFAWAESVKRGGKMHG